MRNPESPDISAQAYLARLAERGIDYVFANAGTDFAPVIESLAMNANGQRKFPRVIIVPHENVAMAMAHGYYKIAGKPAAVMVHVTVGTGNTVNGLMNAARDNIPILLAAGRTPITETGHHASRNRPIHWGQESFDQGGMVREFTKWDYELRSGQPVAAIVDRALDIAMSEPRGPVYLTLPRADVVLVLDARVPWVPKAVSPGRDAKIIHISPDPLQTQYPFRDFEADLLITGTTRGALPLLRESLRKRMKRDDIETRRTAIAALREELVAARRRALDAARARTPISTSHIAACLNELKTEDAIIINELCVPISQLQL